MEKSTKTWQEKKTSIIMYSFFKMLGISLLFSFTMNKNTTILIGAIAVLAIGAGAYVTMSSPSSSDKSFSTQSVRWGTRSLGGGTTIQSKSTTTKITTDTSRGVPTLQGWDGDALSCDTSTITSSLKLVSIKDSNTKTPQLEKWSTVTFRQCLDLWDCTQEEINKYIKIYITPRNTYGHELIHTNTKDAIFSDLFINWWISYWSVIGISNLIWWCIEFSVTLSKELSNEICMTSDIYVFDGLTKEEVDWNFYTNSQYNFQPYSQCFNLNTQAEQAPNTPTAIGDSM
jgi:hypothetical protein